jgi:UDP:flavonoid glycosyltransferase YjiC (YdhE family)
VGVLSWGRSRYRRRFRRQYNSGKYKKSLRNGRIAFFFLKDRIGLDVSARSALRLRKYALASRLYSEASRRGWKLRDHEINHFEATLKSGSLVESFNIAINANWTNYDTNPFKLLAHEILHESLADRDEILRRMSIQSNLPIELAELVPDSVRKIPEGRIDDSKYTMLDSEEISVERYRREVHRLRFSPSFRVGQHFVDAFRKPWKIPLLPLSIPILAMNLLRERPSEKKISESTSIAPLALRSRKRNCIVMFPTNGVGFGHFTRLLSLARRLRSLDQSLEIVFFTTMPTLQFLEDEGFPTYHLPGRYRYDEMEPREWNAISEELLSMVFSIHRPSAFVFDGAYPYRGMLNSILKQPMLKIWLRRGAIRNDSTSIPEDALSHFDAVIRPGDSVNSDYNEEVAGGIPVVTCNPITLFDPEELAPKGTLRHRMGIPEEATLAYVQLGAGKINNINSELKYTLEALDRHEHIFTILGESILGERQSFNLKRLRILRDYPNSLFFKDIDLSIMAAGYNSFHEAIQSGIPTLCYPNMKTGRDDQLARARVAESAGSMVVLEHRTKRKIFAAIDRMIDLDVLALMRENAKILQRENGAEQAASWILDNLQ